MQKETQSNSFNQVTEKSVISHSKSVFGYPNKGTVLIISQREDINHS